MQRDIRSFYKNTAPQKKVEPSNDDDDLLNKKRKKRTARVISSDEDEIPESPIAKGKTPAKKKRTDDKSPHNTQAQNNKKPSLSKLKNSPSKKLKAVDPNALFGGETLRVEAKKPPPPKIAAVIELEDDEINKSLMEVDLVENTPPDSKDKLSDKRESRRSKSKTPRKSPRKEKQPPVKPEKSIDVPTPKKDKQEKEQTVADEIKKEKIATPKAQNNKEKSTPKAKKQSREDFSVFSDEERHERKRMSAILYQKYKNRASVINPGSKEVPKGKPNCLAGLTFLVTGVLESLERDEAASIIKELGGKMVTTVGKRLNYLVVGEEAGPKKLVQAEEFGINVISEDGLFDLIREKSGDRSKQVVKEETQTEKTILKSPKKESKVVKEEKQESTKKEKKTSDEKIKIQAPNKDIKTEKSPSKDEKVTVKREKVEPDVGYKVQEGNVETKKEIDDSMLPWVDKYKPTSVKEIVGQFGATSNVSKLTNWLSKWYINHDGKKKLQKPNPWAKNDDGSFYKAALLSGPPGIGKTTTATLVCKELGFDTVEFNASDTRSKRLLKEEVAELLSNKSLFGYFHGQGKSVTKKHVLLMDEVDGMAGNEDRGGIQELIALIKESSVPIICMCNDRNHQKMRSLVNYCYDLRFNKPRTQQIKGRILSICCKEGFKIDGDKVDEIIEATNNDIRQSINHISLLSAGKYLKLPTKGTNKTAEKDLKMGPWEVVRKVFSAEEHKHMTLNDKCDLFFQDYSMGPLFVQQNYLQVSPVGSKSDIPFKVASTADALSLGDLVDKRIRSNSAWSLLPTQAIFSSVLPGEYMSGHFTGQINFPGWLGKYSRSNKRSRLAQEIHDHTRLRTSASRQSIRLDYAPFLLAKIVRPLKELGMEGVEQSLEILKEYHLLREDIDSLVELATWPGKKSLLEEVDGRVKAALTRTYNKEVLAYSYSVHAGVKKKKAEATEETEMYVMDGEGEEVGDTPLSDEEEDKIENDGLIKAKKASASSKAKAAPKAKAATSSASSKKSAGKASTSKAKK
ncbi:replication factor C subunit 1 [Zeugodacus cucurbitae]|uniref:replication factor C subunit 1 n=1 Tax=Zeugodacus cucurbitae TaxID=28588 RepID=UPI000596A4FA|nr:replication factor C subunit 1 [Zeugodacus cucurbitae]